MFDRLIEDKGLNSKDCKNCLLLTFLKLKGLNS